MAVIYLRSTDGSDSDDGSTWALAKATLNGALSAAVAGDTIYVSHVHAETQGSTLTVVGPGTAASPVKIICVNDGAEPPTTLATTGSIATTSNSTINIRGFSYYYGVTFSAGDFTNVATVTFGNTSPYWLRMDACKFVTSNTVYSNIYIGLNATSTDDGLVEFINCTVKFTHTGAAIVVREQFRWIGGSVDGSVATPTALLTNIAGGKGDTALVRGVDLSALGSGCYLVSQFAQLNRFTFENCKLGASVGLSTGTVAGQGGFVIRLINCDSADTNYSYAYKTYQGDITHETTIVRTGGASDGTTSISRKMVSTANSKFYSPLEMDPIVIWNESTSSLTVTVHIVTDNVTLTDAECWIEVEELGTSGYPLSVTQSDRAADILATPANQTTSTETWTTTGLTTPVYQKLHTTFTPAEKGPIKVRVMLAKASTTVYVCPKVEVA